MSFKSFQFAEKIIAQIKALDYINPTPIQHKAIPVVLEGKDVLGLAQTGTGKTAAFVLPILQHLLNRPRGGIRALIIAPTRELAEQTNTFIKILGKRTNLRSLTVYGGVNSRRQIMELDRGVDIVVGCPGRLLDHLKNHMMKLNCVEILVLDEADRMFDMGFLPDIKKILHYIPKKRQTLLFSATMPETIQRLAYTILKNPCFIEVDYTSPLKIITHFLFPVKQHLKTSLLLEILKTIVIGKTLVFARTKYRAKKLGEKLNRNGYRATTLQGNLSQSKRREALNGFRNGSYQILVATDIAARGIDVSDITHVINFDIPETPDAYTHRIGRTGRAGCKGEAFTFVTQDDSKIVYTLERKVGVELKCRTIDGFDYDSVKSSEKNGNGRRFRNLSLGRKKIRIY